MRKIFTFLVLLIPFASFAKNNTPLLPSEDYIEYHHGKLYFTPRGSSESSYFGWIISKTEYQIDELMWSCTTCVQSPDQESEIHTLNYRFDPKTHLADITSEDASVTGQAQLIGTPQKWEEVFAKITFIKDGVKFFIDLHESIHEDSLTIKESLFKDKESEDSLIGIFNGKLSSIAKEQYDSFLSAEPLDK